MHVIECAKEGNSVHLKKGVCVWWAEMRWTRDSNTDSHYAHFPIYLKLSTMIWTFLS